MGMFDSVLLSCPKCHNAVEFQSKAGKCTLHTYTSNQVPIEIAIDINGDTTVCENCGYVVTASITPESFKFKIVLGV